MFPLKRFAFLSAPHADVRKPDQDYGPPVHSPITVPPASSTVTPPRYTEEQQKLIEQLSEYANTLLLPETDDYHVWEKRFLADPGTCARYMRAGKWKLEDAKKRLEGTMVWRRSYRPELIEPMEVELENETGKLYLSGFDKEGRPLLYMRIARQNTDESPRQIRNTVYFLERAIDLMPPGQEKVALVIDYASASRKHQTSLSTAREVLNILQNHYVERLGLALVLNIPWFIEFFLKAVSPFIDPVSLAKVQLNPLLPDFVEAEQLETNVGGAYNFEYKHETYWRELNDGGRTCPQGKPWVPPTGNGIKAAVDEYNGSDEKDSPSGLGNAGQKSE